MEHLYTAAAYTEDGEPVIGPGGGHVSYTSWTVMSAVKGVHIPAEYADDGCWLKVTITDADSGGNA